MVKAMPPYRPGRQLAARSDAPKAGFRSGSDRLRGQRCGRWLAGKHRVLTTELSPAANSVLAGCRPHATGSTGADHDLSALFAEPEATDRSPQAAAVMHRRPGPSGLRCIGSRSSQVRETGGRTAHQGGSLLPAEILVASRPRCPQAGRQRPAPLVTAPRTHAASVRRTQRHRPAWRGLAGLG
jgi:hypothetical protein